MSETRNLDQSIASETAPLLDQQDEVGEDKSLTRKQLWILPALAIGVFLGAADQTIVVSSYGKIGSELNALNKTSWLATGYAPLPLHQPGSRCPPADRSDIC